MKTWAKTELDEPFAERVDRMARELGRAIRWDRPSILLAIYSSEFVRADAEAALEDWLREQGQEAALIQVTRPADADVPLRLREWPDRDRTVFFVSGLRWGAPTSWNALNVRREYLVEDRIRAVFWLTEGEAAELPQRAPDFWAFRHRVVEFVEPPDVGRAVQKASEMAWAGFEERLSPEERQARIVFRERLLAELPDEPETTAARAELHYTLGGLCYWEREYETAREHFQAALNLAEWLENTQLQSWSLNGLGNVYRAQGRQEEAIAAYQRAIELDPALAHPHYGLGNVYSDLGRQEEAIAAFQRAIELDPTLAHPHTGQGNVYRDLGRQEEAIAAYQRAIELDPNDAYPYANLADIYATLGCYDEAINLYQKSAELEPRAKPHNGLGNVYRALGRQEEAIAAYQCAIELDPNDATPHTMLGALYEMEGQLERAQREHQRAVKLEPDSGMRHASLSSALRKLGREAEAAEHLARARELMANESDYNKACIESITGNADVALEHLARALERAPGNRAWARRDPDLAFIRDDPRFRELVGSTSDRGNTR